MIETLYPTYELEGFGVKERHMLFLPTWMEHLENTFWLPLSHPFHSSRHGP